uniref:AB hydrolase-1 domain-containing protein n=1 Tax=Solanum lycopersicum TaxID=4081 RepID=A0A3Q7HF98_SOLLC
MNKHGAWSWYKIIRSSGHNVTALDLEFMTSLPADEKIVLVCNSIGGLSISKSMETFPGKIAVAVFLSGPNISASSFHVRVRHCLTCFPAAYLSPEENACCQLLFSIPIRVNLSEKTYPSTVPTFKQTYTNENEINMSILISPNSVYS